MNSSSQHHRQWYKVVITQSENKFFCLTSWLRSDLKMCHFYRETFQRVSPEISLREQQIFFFLLKPTRNRYTAIITIWTGSGLTGGWVLFGAGWVLRKQQCSHNFLRLTTLFPALHFQTVGGKTVWE